MISQWPLARAVMSAATADGSGVRCSRRTRVWRALRLRGSRSSWPAWGVGVSTAVSAGGRVSRTSRCCLALKSLLIQMPAHMP